MTDLLAFLAANMRVVLLGLGLAGALVLAWIAWLLARSRAAKQDQDKKGKSAVDAGAEIAGAPVAMVTQAAELEVSFRAAMKTLRAVTSAGGPGHRYRTPWYLALGPVGSGTSTLLSTLPLPRRVQGVTGATSSAPPATWHFYDGGVVVDVGGSLVLKRNLSSDEVGWRRLLSLLKRYRPERPIDGVILAISAADLLEWERRPADELRAIGERLFTVLRQAQRELGVRFPVYVVLTHADRLPGFSAFAQAVPRRFHQDMFGWSTPYALDSAFREEWVDEALSEIGDRLRSRSTEVLASRSRLEDADAVFRFPDVIERLLPASRAILTEIFASSAYHEAFFLRGMYLTGLREVAAQEAAGSTAAPSPEAASEGPAREEAVFATQLFARKIFPERGLARGFRRGILDRNRTIRWLQAACAAVVLLGAPGMWFAKTRLEQKAQPLEELLASIGTNLTTMSRPGTSGIDQVSAEGVVFSLLQQMATLDAGPFWALFLPSSWFSDIDEEITENLSAGFQDVILPTLRQGIVEWTDTLSDDTWARTLGGRITPQDGRTTIRSTRGFQEFEVLAGYLSELRQFAESAERFNLIAAGRNTDIEVFSQLFEWYYEQRLPDEFFANASFYQRALAGASERPVSPEEWVGFEAAASRVAVDLADRLYIRLVAGVSGLERSLAGTVDPAFSSADLRMLWNDIGLVHDLLTLADSSWFVADGGVSPALQVRLDSLPDDSGLFSKAQFLSRFEEGFSEVRRRHLTALSRELEVLARALPPGEGAAQAPGSTPRLDIAPQLAALEAALGDLLNRGFMAPTPDVDAPAMPTLGGRPTWSMAPLDEALGYFTELQSFRDGGVGGIPAELRSLVLGVAGRALEERVRWALGRAMTFEVAVGPEGRAGLEEDLRRRLAAFDGAARRLVAMLEMDEQLGGTPAGTAVAETIVLEGADILHQVDRLLQEDRLYQPVNNLSVWRGEGSASLAGFGVADADALEAYLARQRETVRRLSAYAAPILGYFALAPVADVLRTEGDALAPETEELTRKWRAIIRALDDYEAKAPGNPVDALELFVRQGMAVSGIAGCAEAARARQGAAAPRDWFEGVTARLGRTLGERCRQLARQALLDGYQEMSRFFTTRLAGRFPFVDLAAVPDAPDADVAAVQELFAIYGRVTAPLAGDAASMVDVLLGDEMPADFFRQVAEARAFLAPLLAPPAGTPPALPYQVEFRVHRAAEVGGDQIVDWSLDVGGDAFSYRRGATGASGLWRLGDPVAVGLTWASESTRRPVADPDRRAMTVADATATWRYDGPWSLLRMLAAHRPATALTGLPGQDLVTANLRVTTRSMDARAEPGPFDGSVASVFLRLRFASTPGGIELAFPRFPTHVPPPARR